MPVRDEVDVAHVLGELFLFIMFVNSEFHRTVRVKMQHQVAQLMLVQLWAFVLLFPAPELWR